MEDSHRCVWVKTSALDKAVVGRTRRRSTRSIPLFPPDLDLENFTHGNDDDIGKDGSINWGWTRGTIITEKGDSHRPYADVVVVVNDDENVYNRNAIQLPADSIEKGDILMDNSYENENYPDDLITLTHLHEPAVLHCLRHRYEDDRIYTATGPILIAVNPFKDCYFFYSESVMKRYRKRGELGISCSFSDNSFQEKNSENGLDNDTDLPPHIFGISDNAYRSMMTMLDDSSATNCNQSVIVSGESGTGKTVTTRFVMQYLATLSRRRASVGRLSSPRRISSRGVHVDVEQQVLQSNPILESFGNARTIRNDNSSRFGKFIQINFTSSGSISGASVETYLLEKVRLLSQFEGERNYHIFYELLEGMEEEELERYFLKDKTAKDFNMTNNSGTFDRRDGVDDGSMYQGLLEAMDMVGFSTEKQTDVFAVICAMLHASNLTFNSITDDESEIDMNNAHLKPFLSLMGIKADALNNNMCYFSIRAGKETHIRSLSKNKCEKGMEALIKATYGALFSFIVKQINSSISVYTGRSSSKNAVKQSPSIGVLDIFGFESFKTNSFEQICINYCNEMLQQQFNTFILKNEQEEYEREGIKWSFISFPDNQDVLDLIDSKRTGIISLLADQCRVPGTTDRSFANAMYKTCSSCDRFQANHRQIGSLKFAVNHYAGLVEYDIEGFIGKNRDELPKGATDLLRSSSNKFVNALAGIISPIYGKSSNQRNGRFGGNMLKSSIAKITVGETFSLQLRDLRQKIANTCPHYVRCLKPNDELVPDKFDPVMVLDQLRSGGVVEAVRVSCAGYPQRYSHEAFIGRYKALRLMQPTNTLDAKERLKSLDVSVRDVVKQILDETIPSNGNNGYHLHAKDIQIGETKVFLRQQAFDILESLLIRKKKKSAIIIQANTRRYFARRSFFSVCLTILFLQCCARRKIAARRAKSIRQCNSAIIIQKVFRQKAAHHSFNAILLIARWTQRMQRGRAGRAKYDALNRERKTITIQKYWRRYTCTKSINAQKKAVLLIQCFVRQQQACINLKRLRREARSVRAITEERDHLRKEIIRLKRELEKTMYQSKDKFRTINGEVAGNSDTLCPADTVNKEELYRENIVLHRDLEISRSLLQKESEKADKALQQAADLSRELNGLRRKLDILSVHSKEDPDNEDEDPFLSFVANSSIHIALIATLPISFVHFLFTRKSNN